MPSEAAPDAATHPPNTRQWPRSFPICFWPHGDGEVWNRALALWACLRIRRKPNRTASERRAGVHVPILLAGTGETEVIAIRRMLKGTPYLPVSASGWEDTSRLLTNVVFPIILCDCACNGTDWQMRIHGLLGARHAPAIVLVWEANGRRRCAEAVGCGAFNVLIRPYSAEELLSALNVAHTKWLGNLARGRRPCCAMTAPPLPSFSSTFTDLAVGHNWAGCHILERYVDQKRG